MTEDTIVSATSAATSVETRARVEARASSVPWYLTAVVFASTSVIVGLLWDISWHRTIGRDRFLTPAHVAIYLGGVVAGLACGALALKTTFVGSAEERAQSVRFWGFRAPLGAWLSIWGSFAMLTSAPFDNWWHNAYGLDVQILSPPHAVLGVGMIAIEIGAMLMVLAHQNRLGATSGPLRWLFVYSAGIALLMAATFVWEYTGFANLMHSALFYKVSAIAFPLFMIAPARAGKMRWPATAVAATYMLLTLAMMWILPLFKAQPMLAPIYNPITYMQPPTFPLLLIVPAFAFDLLLHRFGSWARAGGARRDAALAVVLGVTFIVTLLAAQWFLADFLLTPAARNPLFAGDHWSYTSHLGPWRYEFWDLDRGANGTFSLRKFATGLGIAAVIAFATSWRGLSLGKWMSQVQR
jgi:hypothetical protein